jgi:hypothetical protein
VTINFKADDWFRIKGRGWVASCTWPQGEKLSKLREAKGTPGEVTIDGVPVTVTGIETFQPLYMAPIEEDRPPSDAVGLLIRDHDCVHHPRKVPRCPFCERGVPRRDPGA